MVLLRLHLLVLVSLGLLAIGPFVLSGPTFALLLPTALVGVCGLGFYLDIGRRGTHAPFFEVGVFFVAALFFYATFPALGILLSESGVTEYRDNRLFNKYQIGPEDAAPLVWRYLLLLCSFWASYRAMRNDGPLPGHAPRIPPITILIVAGIGVITFLYGVGLKLLGAVDLSASYGDVSENLVRLSSLPLVVVQVTNHALQIGFVCKLIVLVGLFGYIEYRDVRYAIAAWVCIEVVLALVEQGSRSSLFLTLVAVLLLVHTYARRLSSSELIGVGTLLVGGFLVFGFARMNYEGGISASPINVLTTSNEFQSLLGTAYDIYRMRNDQDLNVPLQLYIADFVRPIPQQVIGFEKIDQSEWYLAQIGIDGTGVGFSFGIVSEALVGFDWVELCIRGLALGWLLASIHNYYASRPSSIFRTIIYLWLCLKSYLIVRNSMFYLIAPFLYQVVPMLLVLKTRRLSVVPNQTNKRRQKAMSIAGL